MNQKQLYIYFLSLLLIGCISKPKTNAENWCNQTLRTQFSELKEIKTSSDWFKVYELETNTYAIAEPYNFQEVISYLIIGNEKAVLFDSGMGLSSIAKVVKQLTELPIIVINSHTHYDHIGGNHEFKNILAMNTEFTKGRSKNGLSHNIVKHEVASNAFCSEKLPELDVLQYYINPFPISQFIEDGSIINLGNRSLEIIAVPGHTIDAIALLDKTNGLLWTGDTFYEGPIWLFDEGTDLSAYQKSIEKLSALSPHLKKVFPAHNTPVAKPIRLVELTTAFNQVITGTKIAIETDNDTYALFEFEHFSFMIRRNLLD
ncbi:MBL fold metallo-hydrolase [Flavobacteriaceae bacterium AU392]|nr:MBL fold metallo-hydrolase [Flavobacteriaceae bacterium]RKM82657.1 MBL fold metallo-hydrolase [Flavobacteriaceae bacterium AU392]